MIKHTPGPWHVGAGNGEGSVFAQENTGYARLRLDKGITTLYPICNVTRGWNDGEDAANARLIAAAPDMHALLRDVVALLDNPDADQFSADAVERRILDILSKVEAA